MAKKSKSLAIEQIRRVDVSVNPQTRGATLLLVGEEDHRTVVFVNREAADGLTDTLAAAGFGSGRRLI